MKTNPLIELVILAAIWGASFLFMRIASPEFGPVLLMALRTLIASLVLLPVLFLKKQHKALHGKYQEIFIVGMFNTAIPFVLFGYATLTLSAGVTSVLNATTPMFGVLVAFLWFKEKPKRNNVLGLVVGFIGVYLLMSDKSTDNASSIILPTIAVLLATFCYGFAANLTKAKLSGIGSLALATGSQVSATLVLLPLSLCFLPDQPISNDAIYAVIVLGVVCTGFAYILFFRLIAAMGPNNAITVTYLIPVFGILWGTMFLQESITTMTIVGSLTILFGVGLTTGVIGKRK
ncbi:DMT family transporter [Thalassotalea sp. LPB0316]|uniref:DMT family transporter n=1 Tax=Thalassotalea sp. LPB0316 TaxID=2769490 RepID=UPI0018694B98|nr:DMT family transporter [Thalassotalea sp. LPB0316]QOL24744.1 DMT family transporter [Thalassotalea sp. LPB0316]